jgi:hypothetical protein
MILWIVLIAVAMLAIRPAIGATILALIGLGYAGILFMGFQQMKASEALWQRYLATEDQICAANFPEGTNASDHCHQMLYDTLNDHYTWDCSRGDAIHASPTMLLCAIRVYKNGCDIPDTHLSRKICDYIVPLRMP